MEERELPGDLVAAAAGQRLQVLLVGLQHLGRVTMAAITSLKLALGLAGAGAELGPQEQQQVLAKAGMALLV
jgi:hypothetical protein